MSDNERARVVVVVPSWNDREATLTCLRSLASVTSPALRVVVVDNGSNDGSAAAVREAAPSVELIELSENSGFTGAVNLGFERARKQGAEFAFLLNNDAVVDPDAIRLLVAALDADPGAAAAGPTVYFADQPGLIYSAGGSIDWRHGQPMMLRLGDADVGQLGETPSPVAFINGCAMLIRLEAVARVGALDPRFFAYYEEVEWCVRCSRHGLRTLYVPRARVWHRISVEARSESPLVRYYMTRNHLLFLRATGAPASAWIWSLLQYIRTLLSWSLRPKWRGKREQRDAMLRAVADFYLNRLGRAPLAGA